MKNYFLTHKLMDKKSNVLKAVATAAVLATAPTTGVEASQIVCKTKQACELLSKSIQTQIKKIENSADPDFDKLDELQNKLIALENNIQETENNKQAKQRETIADKEEIKSAYNEVNSNLLSIKGSL